jgi:hypothetical protein
MPLRPEPGAPRRIADGVIEALAATPQVRAISLFGSLASGTEDRWSDVDLMVGYGPDGGARDEDVEWEIAGALRAWRPVLFYRMFTGVGQPSGRYWFEGESPFNQVDAGFYSMPEYERARVEGVREGFPVQSTEQSRRDWVDSPARGGGAPLTITEEERELSRPIYGGLKTLKARLRGEPVDASELRRRSRDLEDAASRLPRDAIAGGGALGELVHSCRDLYEAERIAEPIGGQR